MTVKRRLSALARVARLSACIALPAVTGGGYYQTEGPDCRPLGPSIGLPSDLSETSGVAVSIRTPGLVWTHNDGGHGPFLYAIDGDGKLRIQLELNQSNRDWEDIARGRCSLGACLYVADTGDNDERRDVISFYRLAEPETEGFMSVVAERFRMVLPDGPRDIESMYVLPTEQIFFVTKGRNHGVTIYRYPSPLRSDEVVTLVEVQRLTTSPASLQSRVTGASATLDGSTVAIRTYESLSFFDVTEGGRLLERDEGRVNLRSLREGQGEGVGFGVEGAVVLTSEANGGSRASITFLRCVLN